ncbi:hypothetical protein LUZ60_014028 [Juncus effusus]|nr:hypothetical protein LUZ60_014028 [Juncus effusus]
MGRGEEMDEYSGEEEEAAVVVGQMPTVMVPRHINKRSLKNKGLSVSFDEKNLRDYVTGFHKRKKKRRKEAQKQVEEKDRKKRIADRKKRKQEKEMAMYGRLLSEVADQNEDGENEEGEEESDLTEPIQETRTYEDNSTRVIVTTSEISKEDVDLGPKPLNPNPKPVVSGEKNPSLTVKKKPLKKISKQRSRKKSRNGPAVKTDKRVKKARNNKGRKK